MMYGTLLTPRLAPGSNGSTNMWKCSCKSFKKHHSTFLFPTWKRVSLFVLKMQTNTMYNIKVWDGTWNLYGGTEHTLVCKRKEDKKKTFSLHESIYLSIWSDIQLNMWHNTTPSLCLGCPWSEPGWCSNKGDLPGAGSWGGDPMLVTEPAATGKPISSSCTWQKDYWAVASALRCCLQRGG